MARKTRTREQYPTSAHTQIMQEWAKHLWDSLDELRKEISSHKDDMKRLRQEVDGQRQAQEALGDYAHQTHTFLTRLHERVTALESRPPATTPPEDTEGQQRTQKDTKRGHVPETEDIREDTKGQQRTQPEQTQGQRAEPRIVPKVLNQAQEELLAVFYRNTEPHDYRELARQLNKKEKTVRNLIYELREKGIGIYSCHIGNRKKGFYISEEEKLKISGR